MYTVISEGEREREGGGERERERKGERERGRESTIYFTITVQDTTRPLTTITHAQYMIT